MAPTPECIDAEACEMTTSLRRERVPDDCDDDCDEWTFVRARKKHDIFLSHSGSQKDFVEQLCKDLVEVQLSPFFDRLRHCLPKGKEYAERILKAARECEVAVVVISDEYFSRSKWPMLELEQLMQAEDPKRPWRKILPLFLKLSCEECKEPERQERWFRQWEEWAKSDNENRIDVGRWKNALRKLFGMSGFEFVKAVGEVGYREGVVKSVREMMQMQDFIVDFEEYTSEGNQNPILHPDEDRGRFQRLTSKFCKWTIIICFPFWCAALLKLFMVKVVIIIIVLYIVLYTFIAPIVRDTIECLQRSEHLNIETISDRYRQHLN